jgi:hypothetical protein
MIRMTPDEYAARQEKIKTMMLSRIAAASVLKPGDKEKVQRMSSRKNKYGAQPTIIAGHRFDSKAEATRFLQLKALEQAGDISDLETQVSYELIPSQDINGRKERPVKYLADFRYIRDGKTIVEDVKSAPTKTKEFIIKRKLVLWIHGVVVQEVLMS